MTKLVPLMVLIAVVVLVPLVVIQRAGQVLFGCAWSMNAQARGYPVRPSPSRTEPSASSAFDGSVLFWLDTALMKRLVHFTIEQRGVTTTVDLSSQFGAIGGRARASALTRRFSTTRRERWLPPSGGSSPIHGAARPTDPAATRFAPARSWPRRRRPPAAHTPPRA